MRFNWRRGLKKDLGTIVGLTMGFILVPVWRTYSLEGWDAAKAPALSASEISIAVVVIYLVLLKLKRPIGSFKFNWPLTVKKDRVPP